MREREGREGETEQEEIEESKSLMWYPKSVLTCGSKKTGSSNVQFSEVD